MKTIEEEIKLELSELVDTLYPIRQKWINGGLSPQEISLYIEAKHALEKLLKELIIP